MGKIEVNAKIQPVHTGNAGINLTGYHPPPPRANRRATNFFQYKTPAPGSANMKQTPHPRA